MSIRRRIRMLLLGLATAASLGCAAPAPEPATALPARTESPTPQAPVQAPAPGTRDVNRAVSRDASRETSRPVPDRAPPMSDPLPPQVEETPPVARGAVVVDRSCRTDADCTVKNVGNCCGAFPACVNAKSPTDPEGVKAQCARSGMASVCGFEEIRGCQCVKGECRSDGGTRLVE